MWIARYEPRWHSQVVKLATEVFGEGHLSSPWEKLQQPDSLMFVACDDDDDSVLGFAHGSILPEKTLARFLGPGIEDIPEDIAEADAEGNLAVIDVVAVSPAARRIGRTWMELLVHTLDRGVKVRLIASDFDPLAAPHLHQLAWRTLRQTAAVRELARDDAKLILSRDPELEGERGAALRVMLYLFERDSAVGNLRSG